MIKSKGKAICLAVMLTVMLPSMAASQPATPVWGEWLVDQTVSGCIEIRNGDTLTIYPGVTVSFEPGAHLIVRSGGTLIANPTSAGCPDEVARVVFTQTGTSGGWDGIVVESGGSATLNFVDIMNSTNTGLKIMSGASVGAMTYMTFSGNSGVAGGGLYAETSVAITNGLFSGNSAALYGGGIEMIGGGTLTLQDVDFTGNSATYSGGGIDLLSSNVVMVRGQLSGNSSPAGSAVMAYGGGAVVTNAFFYNNSGGPVLQRVGDTATTIAQSTFNGNAGVACIAANTDDNLALVANILWGNGSALDVTLDAAPVAAISYCDVEDIGTYPSAWFGAGNFDLDPELLTAGDYLLDPSSPCVGAALGEDMGVTGGVAAPGPAPALIDLTGAAIADPFDVGSATVGGSITRTITIVNQGQDEANILSVDLVGAQAAAFSLGALSLPAVLAPGECLDVLVTFTPPAPGDYSLVDLVVTTALTTIVNGLTGDTQEGSGTDVTPNPTTVAFGGVLVNTESMPMQFTLTNPLANGGIVPVTLALTGSDAGFFTLSETEFTIPEGGTRTVWATFAPNALRSFEAIVTPTVNGVPRPDRAILLIGTGIDVIYTVDTTEHQFPPTIIGTSDDVDVTVTNILSTTSILVSAEITGSGASNFSLDMASAPIDTLSAQAFNVTFSPVAEGFVQATLTFTSVLDSITYTETVDLRGVGISTSTGIAVAPLSISFPDTSVGSSASSGFVVANALDDFVSITISTPAAAEFSIASASSFILFPAGDAGGRDQRIVAVSFSPSDATSLFSASVDVVGTLGIFTVGSETVTMDGRGIDADIEIAPDEIDFGDVDLATTSSTVSVSVLNTGTESANIFAGLLGGDDAAQFNIDSDTCSGISLGAGVGCFYEVSVTPTAEGALEATLSIYTSESPTATVVDLLATGVVGAAAAISVTPTTIDMGDVAVFIASTTFPGIGSVTIENTGTTANLIVTDISFSGYHAGQFIATPPGALPRTIAPGASEVVSVTLLATGLGPRATTMTIVSNAGNVDVSVSGDSQVGYPNVDGLGWNADGTTSAIHADRADVLYVVPGFPESYWRQLITALDALLLPADRFVWIEGAGFRQFYDVATTTWTDAAAETDIQSADAAAILELIALEALAVGPTLPAEGQYSLHFGFDLIRDNMITNLPYFYVDYARTLIYGPHPVISIAPTTLTVGDLHPTALFVPNAGTSTTAVEVYIWAQPASGGTLYLDGVGTWSATQAPVYTGDISLWAGLGIADPWTGYAISDSGQVGTHTFYVTFDRTADGVLNDRIFEDSVEVTVNPAP